MSKKFSQFTDGEELRIGDQVVGLRDGINDRFNFPSDGIKNGDGYYLFKWETVEGIPVNFIQITNAITSEEPIIEVVGTDENIGLTLTTKADGDFNLEVPQDGDMNLTLGGSGSVNITTPTGYIDLNGTTPIKGVLDEDDMASNSAIDTATQQSIKAYADSLVSSNNFLIATEWATTTNLNATYDNGSSGVGATLTAVANGAASIDGGSPALNSSILFKDQTTGYQNGVYTLTQVGDAGTPAIYTRHTFFDTAADMKVGNSTFTVFGNTNAKKGYQLTSDVVTVGFSDLDYQQITIPTLASATDNRVVRMDGTSGGQIQESVVSISDAGATTGITQLDVDNIRIDGNTISSTNGNGDINLTNNGTGKIVMNATTAITGVLDEDNMSSDSPTHVPTQQSVKAYVDAQTIDVAESTFITNTDETADLPNSDPLSAKATGILASTTTTGALTTRVLTGTANQINVANGDGSAAPTFTISSTLVTPGTTTLGGTLYVTGQNIEATSGNVTIITDGSSAIDLDAPTVLVETDITHAGDTNNKITFGTDTQNYQTGGTSRLDISDSGVRLGATDARITSISNDTGLAADSATLGVTQHAVKTYVDSQIVTSNFFISTLVASTANFSSTYNNGASGVGATLTASINGAASIDGVSLALGNLVLFKDQTNGFENGVYSVTQVGDGGTPAIYTRYVFFDALAEMKQGYVTFTVEGTVNAKKGYQLTSVITTIGVDNLVYQQITLPTLASATDNAITRWDGTTGGQIQNSIVTITDAGIIAGATEIDIGVLTITSGQLETSVGNDLRLVTNVADSIDLDSPSVLIDTALIHAGDTNNKIVFGTDTQDLQTGGASRLDVSDAGIRMGATGARVTSISTDGTFASDSDTLLATQKAIKTYVDATVVPLQFATADLVATSNITLSGVQTVDGVLTTTQVVLAQNQTSPVDNGLYTADTLGAWTRTVGYTVWANFYRLIVSVTGGATENGTSWQCTVGDAGTVGVDALPFTSAAFQTYTAGTGLTLSENVFSLTAPVTIALGGTNTTSAIGANGTIAQSDGTKYTFTTATYPSTAGTSGKILISDGSNIVSSTPTYPNSASSAGKMLRADGTNWVASTATYPDTATGTGTFLRADGTNWVASTATIPGTAGSSGTLLQSNGTNWVNTTATYPGTSGTSGTLLSSNGTNIVNTTATYPVTSGTSGTILRSNGTNIVNSTSTFADTYAVSTILYASSANAVTGLATVNSATLTTNGSGVPTWATSTTITIPWTEVTGTSQSMAVNNGYIANNAGLVTCTLPTTAAVGQFVQVSGKGAGLFKIGQNASQVIHTGTTDTTTGTGGSLTATNRYDCLTLRCITANTDWVLESSKGAFTIA